MAVPKSELSTQQTNAFLRPSDLQRMGVCSTRRAQELCASGEIEAVRFGSRWLIYREPIMRALGLEDAAPKA